jgi:tyrosyl-tRNA synthetase
LMWRYFTLLADLDARQLEAERAKGQPMQSKLALAERIVADFHGHQAARAAADEWRRVHQERQLPSELPVRVLRAGSYELSKLLVWLGLAASRREAVRLIRAGAAKEHGRVLEPHSNILLGDGSETTLSIGAKRFVRLRGGGAEAEKPLV